MQALLKYALAVIVATAGIGLISAAQHYFSLSLLGENIRSKQVLDDSFVISIKMELTVPRERKPLSQHIDDEQAQLKEVGESIIQFAEKLQLLHLVDIILWTLTLVLSSVNLVLVWRKIS